MIFPKLNRLIHFVRRELLWSDCHTAIRFCHDEAFLRLKARDSPAHSARSSEFETCFAPASAVKGEQQALFPPCPR